MGGFLDRKLMKILLRAHNLLYSVISSYSVRVHGFHPKHDLMRYADFFIANIPSGSSVLDIGCGVGVLAKKLAGAKNIKITAVDINENNIKQAVKKNYHKRINYLVGDATKLYFKEGFDVIILSNVLEHIKNRVAFLKKIKKLAPKLLIRVPMIDRDWLTLYKKKLGVDYRLDPTHYIEYTEESFRKEINKAGLKVETLSIRFGEIYAVILWV